MFLSHIRLGAFGGQGPCLIHLRADSQHIFFFLVNIFLIKISDLFQSGISDLFQSGFTLHFLKMSFFFLSFGT